MRQKLDAEGNASSKAARARRIGGVGARMAPRHEQPVTKWESSTRMTLMGIFYQRTTPEASAAILAGGFRDGCGTYMTDREFSGVWLSDRPLDENDGACGEALLTITVDANPDDYEWVEEGKSYREWLVPAALLIG